MTRRGHSRRHAFRQETLVHDGRRHQDRMTALPEQEAENQAIPVCRRTLGLETMASSLVMSLNRLSSHCFSALCQWPRLHPLDERAVAAVPHHPLIMVESARQLARALELDRASASGGAPLEAVSVNLGLRLGARPVERAGTTNLSVRVSVSDRAAGAGRLSTYRVTAEYFHAGEPFGVCTMRLTRSAGTAA